MEDLANTNQEYAFHNNGGNQYAKITRPSVYSMFSHQNSCQNVPQYVPSHGGNYANSSGNHQKSNKHANQNVRQMNNSNGMSFNQGESNQNQRYHRQQYGNQYHDIQNNNCITTLINHPSPQFQNLHSQNAQQQQIPLNNQTSQLNVSQAGLLMTLTQQPILQENQYSEDKQDSLSLQNNLNKTSLQSGGISLLEHLELSQFKVEQCINQSNHNHKQCKYYHSNKDRRRAGVNYSSDPCSNPCGCPEGDECLKAHNKVEELYCLDKYKTKFCTCYPNNCHNCEYGSYCSFAHSEIDIQIDLIENYPFDEDFYVFYYKTVWCPFNFIKHDKAQCVYSHNWQDYRRRPQEYDYEPIACPFWKPNNYITKYEEGCPNKFNCKKCHGWKESEYHPRNYRTKQCTMTTNNEICNKGPQCPYYHNAFEKRVLPSNIQEGLFKYRPRNRNIHNTYKAQNGQTPGNSQSYIAAKNNLPSSTQSLPENSSSRLPVQKKKAQQKPSTFSQQEIAQSPNIHETSRKPIKLNSTSQLESTQNQHSHTQNQEFNEDDMNSYLNDEQNQSIDGIFDESNRWNIPNGNNQIMNNNTQNVKNSQSMLQNKQQVFKIFANNANQNKFDNFPTSDFQNNNQYYQNSQAKNYETAGNFINPEILNQNFNEMNNQFSQFNLLAYDNSDSDHIFNNPTNNNNEFSHHSQITFQDNI